MNIAGGRKTWGFKLLALVWILPLWPAAGYAAPPRGDQVGGEQDGAKYGYFYKGTLLELVPSNRLVAVQEKDGSFAGLAEDNGFQRDALSERQPLKERQLGIYRLPKAARDQSAELDPVTLMEPLAQAAGNVVQPVFERGQALLIPSDEIILGFERAMALDEAQAYIATQMAGQGIAAVRPHRGSAFILEIDQPADGRCYDVCRFAAQLNEIRFAEPNHIVVMLPEPSDRHRIESLAREELAFSARSEGAAGSGGGPDPLEMTSAPTWTMIASIDCESSTFPPSGWQVGWLSGGAYAYWGRTSYRSYGGSYSIYCAQSGSGGVAAPGPAPLNMQGVLRSPLYNLTGYEEVYVELWFYAKNDLWPGPGGTLCDYPAVYVIDDDAGTGTGLTLGSFASGDCTTDPTSSNGWRKCLSRVPPAYRVSNAFFDFRYYSDNLDQYEGACLDDIRIVGTADVDTEPLGNDTYGARHYDLKNVGQIAGLGNDNNDLYAPEAWGLVSVSTDVVVAVIDEGVDLGHPDLNLVTGYEYDGTVGGSARGPHGTACAGKVGAIIDNSIGVIGVAPNVQIMPIYFGLKFGHLASAIDVAVAHGADVLSNSWGWADGTFSQDIEDAINDALAADRVVLFAAGNGPYRAPWTYDVAWPGNMTGSTEVICVGASSPTDEHKGVASSDGLYYWGSSYVGDGPDVCTPGCWSYTTDQLGANGYNDGSLLGDPDYTPDFGGTSSSTPKAAGVVALMLSVNPTLTPAEVKSILCSSADDIDDPGFDDRTGYGRVNAYGAVLATPPPCNPPTWYSVRLHGGSVNQDYRIELDAADANEPRSESRVGVPLTYEDGLREIWVQFDCNVSAYYTAGQVQVTGGGLVVTGEALTDLNKRLEIYLSGSVNDTCYKIDISNSVDFATLGLNADDADCRVRAKVGDTSGGIGGVSEGLTNLIDANDMYHRNSPNPITEDLARFDVNTDGVINLIDYNVVYNLNSVLKPPCP